MKTEKIDGATRLLAIDQPEFEPLHIRDETVWLQTETGPQEAEAMTMQCRPTAEEIARLVAGEPLFVQILGVRWPPISLWVGGENGR